MRLAVALTSALAAVGSCASSGCPAGHEWRAALPTDRRSPCPMLNALANHGFLARNGLNVSVDDLVNGLDQAINLSPDSSLPVAQLAAATSSTGIPNTLNLDDLDKHGIIEHDGSLSRNDIYFGDNHSFNPKIFATTAAHFTNETISIETAAKARAARLAAAGAANPTFNFTATQNQFSLIESALYLRTFGNGTQGNARTAWVEVLFREERLPYEEGYRRPAAPMLNQEVLDLAGAVAAVPT